MQNETLPVGIGNSFFTVYGSAALDQSTKNALIAIKNYLGKHAVDEFRFKVENSEFSAKLQTYPTENIEIVNDSMAGHYGAEPLRFEFRGQQIQITSGNVVFLELSSGQRAWVEAAALRMNQLEVMKTDFRGVLTKLRSSFLVHKLDSIRYETINYVFASRVIENQFYIQAHEDYVGDGIVGNNKRLIVELDSDGRPVSLLLNDRVIEESAIPRIYATLLQFAAKAWPAPQAQ